MKKKVIFFSELNKIHSKSFKIYNPSQQRHTLSRHPCVRLIISLCDSGITRFWNPISGLLSKNFPIATHVFGMPQSQCKTPTIDIIGNMTIRIKIILMQWLLFNWSRPMAQGVRVQYHMQLPLHQTGHVRMQPIRLQIFINFFGLLFFEGNKNKKFIYRVYCILLVKISL